MSIDEELNRLDLEQDDSCDKLHVRLTHELQLKRNYLNAIAIKESEIDQLKLGVIEAKDGDVEKALELCYAQLAKLKELKIGVLLTQKSSIWNCSNSLKTLHEKRNVTRARAEEQEELAEA